MFSKTDFATWGLILLFGGLYMVHVQMGRTKSVVDADKRSIAKYGRPVEEFRSVIKVPQQELADVVKEIMAGGESVPREELVGEASSALVAAKRVFDVALEKTPCANSEKERGDIVTEVFSYVPRAMLSTEYMWPLVDYGHASLTRRCGPAASKFPKLP